jgi:hypothetical protein
MEWRLICVVVNLIVTINEICLEFIVNDLSFLSGQMAGMLKWCRGFLNGSYLGII